MSSTPTVHVDIILTMFTTYNKLQAVGFAVPKILRTTGEVENMQMRKKRGGRLRRSPLDGMIHDFHRTIGKETARSLNLQGLLQCCSGQNDYRS